jgi:hypothetical protein
MTEDEDALADARGSGEAGPRCVASEAHAEEMADHPAPRHNLAEDVAEFGDTVRAILSL